MLQFATSDLIVVYTVHSAANTYNRSTKINNKVWSMRTILKTQGD